MVCERLAGSGRHEREGVSIRYSRANDLLLSGSKRIEPEELAEGGGQVRQAGEYRGRVERSPGSLQIVYADVSERGDFRLACG